MIARKIALLFLMLCPGTLLLAQPTPVLADYIQTGLHSNLALQQQQLDWQQSLEAVRQARGLFYPTLQFDATYTRSVGGRKIDLPIGDLLNPVYGTLNQLTQSNSFPTIDNQQINFLPDNFQETYLKFAYPLFNSDIRYNKKIKEALADSKGATKAAYEQALRYDITVAYLQYLQTLELEKILQNSGSVLQELRRFNESLVRNNVATRDVLSTADYEISKLDRQMAELQAGKQTAKAYFNFLLNRGLTDSIRVDSMLLFRQVPEYQLDSMLDLSVSQRKELNALAAGAAAAGSALRLQEANRKLPSAYVGGQLGFQGYGYHYGNDQAYGLVQVGLSYDIYQGGQQKSKVEQAQLETVKMDAKQSEVRQQIKLQVTQAWQQLQAAKSALQSAHSGVLAATESFRIVNNKYRANQVLLLEWLDAQNRLNTAQLQEAVSKINLFVQEAALLKATGL